MCPIWPFHLIIFYLLTLWPLWCMCQFVPLLTASFDPENVVVHMQESEAVAINVTGLESGVAEGDVIEVNTIQRHIASVEDYTYSIRNEDIQANFWQGLFKLDGNFIGRTDVYVRVRSSAGNTSYTASNTLPVTVTRPERLIDTIFVSSVATFVSLIFINFGCAMHWPTVKAVMKRPVGPIIGMCGQFLLMPVLSFVLGLLIFPNDPEMRLGMFFTGVAPGGGASNIWTFILGGNLNLSLAMTTISTLASFGFIPAWIFSLGQVVFADANLGVPYTRIATFVFGLIIPLGIGLAMQKFTPRLAAFMVRILKGFSTSLLLFIIIFAIITNLYIFELFSWQILVAGIGLPWIGYLCGYLAARALRQPHRDALAICIETGLQNTGIAIFLLRFALPQPEADLTTVIPVSVAIMTPVPMTAIYIYQRIRGCLRKDEHVKIVEEPVTPESSVATVKVDGFSNPKAAEMDDDVKVAENSNNNLKA